MPIYVVLALFMSIIFASPARSQSSQSGLVVYAADYQTAEAIRRMREAFPKDFKKSEWNAFATDWYMPPAQPYVRNNTDGTLTLYYATLEDLVSSLIAISNNKKQPIRYLSFLNHGMPGRLFLPTDWNMLNSKDCELWRNINSIRDPNIMKQLMVDSHHIKDDAQIHYSCQSGYPEWVKILSRYSNIKSIFAPDVQIRFVSCSLGKGLAGQQFTEWLASQLFSSPQAEMWSLTTFGLMSTSIPSGISFFDYEPIEQMPLDILTKPASQIRINASVRKTQIDGSGLAYSSFLQNQSEMSFVQGAWPEYKTALERFNELNLQIKAKIGKDLKVGAVVWEYAASTAQQILALVDSPEIAAKIRSKGFAEIWIDQRPLMFDYNKIYNAVTVGYKQSVMDMLMHLYAQPEAQDVNFVNWQKRVSDIKNRQSKLPGLFGVSFVDMNSPDLATLSTALNNLESVALRVKLANTLGILLNSGAREYIENRNGQNVYHINLDDSSDEMYKFLTQNNF